MMNIFKSTNTQKDQRTLPNLKVAIVLHFIEAILYYILLYGFSKRSSFESYNISIALYVMGFFMLLLTIYNIHRVTNIELFYFKKTKGLKVFIRSVAVYFLPLTEMYRIYLLIKYKTNISYKESNKRLAFFTLCCLIITSLFSFFVYEPINYELNKKYKIRDNFVFERIVNSVQLLSQGSIRMLSSIAIEAKGQFEIKRFLQDQKCESFLSATFRSDFLTNLRSNRGKTSSTMLILEHAHISEKILNCGQYIAESFNKDEVAIIQKLKFLDYSLMLQENYFNYNPYSYLTFPYIYPVVQVELLLLIGITEVIDTKYINLVKGALQRTYKNINQIINSDQKYSQYLSELAIIKNRLEKLNKVWSTRYPQPIILVE